MGRGRGEDDEYRQQMRVPRQLIVFQKERGCPAVQCSTVQRRAVKVSASSISFYFFCFLLFRPIVQCLALTRRRANHT